MAPIQKLFALTGIALALAVVAPQSMEAEETKTLTVTKDCNTAAALAPGELGYCIIIESNFRPLSTTLSPSQRWIPLEADE